MALFQNQDGGTGIPSEILAKYIFVAGATVALTLLASIIAGWYLGADSAFVKSALPNAITALAILGSALWASWFALQAIETQRAGARKAAEGAKEAVLTQQTEARKTAKLQETLDLILRTELDSEFIQAKQTWSRRNRQSRDGQGTVNSLSELLAKVHYNATDEETDFKDSVLIRMFFNNFEVIALAIRNDIIDGEFYKSWQRSSIIDTWNSASEAIGVIRTLSNNPRLYIEWQELVEKWKEVEPKRSISLPREFKTNDLVKLAGLRSSPAVKPAEPAP